MRKLSSSSSKFFSCDLDSAFCLLVLYSFISLLLNPAIADRFNPLIQLPTQGSYRNTTSWPRTVVLNINDFGATGDGISDDTKSLQDVWKIACSLPVPTKIVIPAGNFYHIRPTDFAGPCQSKLTLRISGLIWAPRDPAVWDAWNVHRWLYFHGVKYLKVEGGGMIDGMGQEWWARSCKTNDSNPCKQAPTAVTFHRCTNLKLKNISIVNAQQIHIAFTNCMRVDISRVNIISPGDSPNTDGIHISASTHVKVKDVIIGTGDDCISIVSNSSGVRIKNAICGPGHGISIGSLGKHNSCDSVEDVIVSESIFFNTENGARIKTWQGGRGTVKKIKFENLWMKNVSNPIIIDQYYCDCPGTCSNQTSAVRIENVSFIGIMGTSAKEEPITFTCSDTYPCKRLYLEKIHLATINGTAKSFCWEAYGTSSGLVYPPSCLSYGDIIVRHGIQPNYTSRGWMDGFSVL